MLVKSKMLIPAMAVAALVAAAPAQAAKDAGTPVCNQAENSFRGTYDLGSSTDPTPPAFNRGLQFAVGAPLKAAEKSPAMAVCQSAPPVRDS